MEFNLPPGLAFGEGLKTETPEMRCYCNIGSFFDILTGYPVKGRWGNMLINGGLWYTDAIVGPNNSFKSTLSKHKLLKGMANFKYGTGLTLDTEISGTGAMRYNSLAQHIPGIQDYDFSDGVRWRYFTNAEVYGDIWWSEVKKYADTKASKENKKSSQLTTPFWDEEKQEYIKSFIPTFIEIDSLSQLAVKAVEDKYHQLDASDNKRNMEDMATAKAKSKIVRDMPVVTASAGLYVIVTAHVGEKKDLDPYNPSMQKFQGMKGNRTVKYIPESFQFNMNNLYEIVSARPMINQNTKAPEFPRDSSEEFSGDTDLMELTINILRGKGGASLQVFPLICSQTEGLLEGLSDWYWLKINKYGVGGSAQHPTIDLYPEETLSRTQVRRKIEENPRLKRALQLQCELYWVHRLNKAEGVNFPRERICSPKELYDDIKALGYDWNELLDTIGEWKFREDEQTKPTLTIYDLLNIRAGEYVPYWKQDAWLKARGKSESMAP